MSIVLEVECPECHAAPGNLCVNKTTGAYMGGSHMSRRMVSVPPDGDVGALASDYLDVECPECHALPGTLCISRVMGEYMSRGHDSRRMVSVLPDGDVGALDPDDPDVDIAPLGDIAPAKQLDYTKDHYPDRTVLRWSQTYGDKTYIYVAVKATGIGWFLSGKTQDAIPWDELWNKHLTKSDWLERADHWEDIHVIHTP